MDLEKLKQQTDVVHPFAWHADHMSDEHYEVAQIAVEALPELIAECKRLRAVYDAACAWRDGTDSKLHVLTDAIDRARGAK